LANAVDFIEPLQWIPTSKRTRAHKLHDGFVEVYGSMIQRFKNLMNSGEEVPDCMMKTLLESQEVEKLDWEDLCMLAAVFTIGGVHSVSGTLPCILMKLSYLTNSPQTQGIIQWFLALIPSHPHVAAKAYEELDRVVGHERCPNAEDEQYCPYIRAIIKEVLNISNARIKTLTYSAYR
jgi:cytochrome P450